MSIFNFNSISKVMESYQDENIIGEKEENEEEGEVVKDEL